MDLLAAYAARIGSLRRVMDLLDFEIDIFAGLVKGQLARDPGYVAVQTIPGIGPVLGAVLLAEIGDITRFPTPQKLTCWAGMTPKHRESDATVRRGKISKQGSRLVRWAAVESVQRLPAHTRLGAFRDGLAAKRGHNIAVVAAARRQLEYVFYALHQTTGLRLHRHDPTPPDLTTQAGVDACWQHLSTGRPHLFDGPLLAVTTVTTSPGAGEVTISWTVTTYRHYLARHAPHPIPCPTPVPCTPPSSSRPTMDA